MKDVKTLKPLSKKHQAFVDQYFICHMNATEAYMQVYKPKSGRATARANAANLLAIPSIKAEIDTRLDEVHMSSDKALKNLSQIADADMGVFWRIVDEWMFNPLPEYEILAEQEVEYEKDDGTKEKRVSYRVRHAVLDMDKVIDPQYSHLIHEFSNSRRRGVSIKTYSRHEAVRDILKIHGKFTERINLSGDGSNGELLIRIIEHKDE